MKKVKSISFSLKPTVSVIALSIAAAFALTACGGGGGGDDNNGGDGGGGGGGGIAYITQIGATAGTGGILQCRTASDGMLTCTPEADTTATTLPAPVALALTSNYAYVLNSATTGGEAPTPETIYKCAITGNALSQCAAEANAGPAEELGGVIDIAVNNGNFYVLKSSQLMQCEYVAATGTVGNCSDEGEGFAVTGLTIAEAFKFRGSRVWIADSGGAGSVVTCAVANGEGGNGAVSGCAPAWTSTAETNPAPMDIAFDTSAANAYVLLRDTGAAGSILSCTVSATDGVLTCDEATATALPAAVGSADRIAVNNGYVYVSRVSSTAADSVIKCAVADGVINAASCVSAVADSSPITGEVTDITFK